MTGQITDEVTGAPLRDAHVFIASSMLGTSTDEDGRFSLNQIPSGAHRLFVSMLGYASAEQDTLIRANQAYEFEIALAPSGVMLEEIVVNAREARRWQRRLLKFERLFIGETFNSSHTRITNPEVLSFEGGLGKLSAQASAPLIIENRALGYRVAYYLKEFFHYGNTIKWDGDPFFTELEPVDSLEAARWTVRRAAAFRGSQRHFLLSLLEGRTEVEGFELWRRSSLEPNRARFGVDPVTLLEQGPTPLEHWLTFRGVLEVVYTGEPEDEAFRRWQRQPDWTRPGNQRSFMELNTGPTLVDETGEVIDPYGVTVYGYYAFERIADKVPKEFRPPGWIVR